MRGCESGDPDILPGVLEALPVFFVVANRKIMFSCVVDI
jgi:hypothetical protein